MLGGPNFIQAAPPNQRQRIIYRTAPGQALRNAGPSVLVRPPNPTNRMGVVPMSITTSQMGRVITSSEAIKANRQAQTIAVKRDAQIKIREYQREQRRAEMVLFNQSQTCPIGIQKSLRDRLGKIRSQEFKALVRNEFYNPSVMEAAMCVTESISYTPPTEKGGVSSNFRIKRWIKNLNKIGAESVEGFALRGDFDRSKNTFIVKSPQDSRNPTLLHEYIIGVYGLNQIRKIIPNFAYILGGFRCSMPVVDDETNKVSAWCNNNKYPIDYVVYENIVPSETMKAWVTRNCNFKDWLTYYLQILYATQIAADITDYTHYDLHDENVLRRKISNSSKSFAIPYKTENGTEYLITDAVATIIDYGLAHIKHKGDNFGVYDRLAWSVFPNRSFPLYDAYKFLLMSMRTMLQNNKTECFYKASQILKFFNNQESPVDIISKQGKTYYYLPYNPNTAKFKIYDLTKYIRKIFDTSSILVPAKPPGRILGCQGTDVCISGDNFVDRVGMSGLPMAYTIFDFYDLIHRFEGEGNSKEVKRITKGFNYRLASNTYKPLYNKVRNKLMIDYKNLVTYFVDKEPLSVIFNSEFLKSYRNYISKVAKIYEDFQELTILYKTLTFAAGVYSDDRTVIDAAKSFYDIEVDHKRLWVKIMASMQRDNLYLQSLRNNPTILVYINEAILVNPSLSWWWNYFPELASVFK